MADYSFIKQVFHAVDNRDSAGFVDFFCETGLFRFANQPPIQGKEAIEKAVAAFFKGLKTLSHKDLEVWQVENAIIINGWVTYNRLNNSQLKIPFSVTLKLSNGLIQEYLVFMDNSEL